MTELSAELKKQIGIMVDRKGTIIATILGDEREILIPLLKPLGRSSLRGVSCIHTHIKGEALTEDDFTDLALLRLDFMSAIEVTDKGLPGKIYNAHLLPITSGKTYEVLEPQDFHDFTSDRNFNKEEFLEALEDEMGRAIVRDIKDERERAILVSVSKEHKDIQMESLEELGALAESNDALILDSVYQRPDKINPKYLMGSGKIKELIIKALQNEATMIIFNQELSPTQVRELSELTELKVIDRTQLILDIFAGRAHSRDGKVQVELAQLKYLLPKLSGQGTSMSRLMGGIGGRGPGETKLEVDRRRVQDRISHLTKQLKSLSQGRIERRRQRADSRTPIVSIVGYTNAGKSTLLNTLTGANTLAEDKLFATLDTTTRRLRLRDSSTGTTDAVTSNGETREIILTDTVGFIKHLPKDLKQAFKATLEEMEDADLLLHVVDVSSPTFEAQMEAVNDILEEMKLTDIPMQLVFNKIDLVESEVVKNLTERYDAIGISAKDKKTLNILLEKLTTVTVDSN